MSIHTSADSLSHTELRPITFGWVLKRAALAIAILTVVISCMAWLTYASIDQQLEAQSDENVPAASSVTKVSL